MHASSDRYFGGLLAAPLAVHVIEPEPREWKRVLCHLREWLSPRDILNTLCAAVAAELSLSTVALLRRGEDGSLSPMASADVAQGMGRGRDGRDGRVADRLSGVQPLRSDPREEVACWTFPDRGGTDVLVFAGDKSGGSTESWRHWARQMAALIVRIPRAFGPPEEAATPEVTELSGSVSSDGWNDLSDDQSARFAASERGIVDQEDDEDILILVKLEGLSELEPLGEAGWQSLLRFSGARLAAMVGEDCVAELGDGAYLVRLPRDTSEAMALVDAMHRALLCPVPGIGWLPSLEVRFCSV